MRNFLFYLAFSLLVLGSCTRDENPPILSYEFSNIKEAVGVTTCIITCRNESIDDETIHARVLLSKNESFENVATYAVHVSGDSLCCIMNDLDRNTLYYYRFEMYTNHESLRIDDIRQFKTLQGGGITVTTSDVINITRTTATGGGSVSIDGDFTITERGICWSTHHNPNNLNDNHATNGEGIGSFAVNMTGLIPDSIYYVRAYAKHDRGVVYGNEVNFATMNANAPTVTTSDVSNITRTSALASGNVTDDGGLEVTERGVCWSTAHAPNIEGSHANNGVGTGGFSVEIVELEPNTTYFVRAYAKNAKDIAYGEEVEFKTAQDISSPVVETLPISNITSSTATGGGNVTNDGGGNVTERGICWSMEHNPTIDDAHASNGTGVGEYSIVMAELIPGATYYVRAYAENSQGISYGIEVSFTTTANPPTVTTGEVSNITQTTALGSGTVTDDGGVEVAERGVCWSTSHNPTLNDSHASNGTGMGGFTVEMTELTSNTTYYVRAYAINSQGTAYGEEIVFKTSHNVSAPTVTTSQINNITQTTATGGGNVTNDGGATVTERGICWSTEHNPTTTNSHTSSGTGTGEFTCNMSRLTAGTTYYVRAYAKNSEGTSYGAEVSFITEQAITLPTVTTAQVFNITQTTATGGGNVTATGNATVTERGICWSTSHNPTISGSHASNGGGTGTYSVNMTGLTPNTTYYVRAYATNSEGTAYGSEVSFTTLQNISLPTVTTSQVTDITQTTATGGGNVTAAGGATVTERGICWSTSHNPTTSNTHVNSGTGIGTFTIDMTNLTANTTYFVRAYATNSAGTAYGAEVSFTTLQSVNPPTVTTSQATNITQTTATGGGNVTATGGGTVTDRGICWSTSHTPTISGNHVSGGAGAGTFSVNMTGLTANTTYFVRAYATNSAGTAYGSEVSFTTLQNVTLPTVTTSQVANITQTTATGGGNVINDGNGTVTERGICWSTSHDPTTSNTHASSGTGTGSYSVNMNNLTANTTYYVRAYAINSAGTAYGAEVSFSTLQSVNPPTVTTSQATNITQTSATGGGNVTATGGGTVTDKGICWSTSHTPTISGNHVSGGAGAGTFSVNMTGLTANTTYFVRAYATNSAGTAYGSEVSFTTLQNVTLPTVTTSQVANITQTTATGGGNVINDGNGTVTERGICWSTSHDPTTSNTHASNGTGTGTYTVSMSNLTANTTYYVRAYAINSAGTAYGSEVSFTTASIPTYTISVSANPTNGGTVTGGSAYQQGQSCTVTATAATGYTFVRWTENGNQVSTNASYTFTVSSNRTLVAQFQAQSYTISVSASPSNGGSVSGGGSYNNGQSCTVMATANNGYSFTNWTENGSEVSTNSSYTFTVTNNRTLVANFTANPQNYTISVSANPTNGGTVIGGGTYQQGQSCTVTATANNGYSFTNWTENGSQVSTNSSYTFTVNSNRTLVANFAIIPQAPTGAINGLFTINYNGDKVWFSQGNLQYKASTNTWRFAERQWDYVGTQIPDYLGNVGGTVSGSDNTNISQTYNGWIDLFGWGTSGYNHGAVCYQPWSTSQTDSDYYAYGSAIYNLYDLTGRADWGYNAISNGGNQTNQWRTLTTNEWQYVFNTRTTSSGLRYAKAKVNNVNGVILLPDNWSSSTYSLSNTNQQGASYNSNTISTSQWSTLENAGAVFLPAAGADRVGGTYVYYVGLSGAYWSASINNSQPGWAYEVSFFDSGIAIQNYAGCCGGKSVRLVYSAQ